MSDPQRLLSEEASPFEKDLLRSWETEQPSEAARARVLAAAGLGVAITAATATQLGTAAGGSLAPKALVSAGGAALAKWFALGAVGLAVTAATVGYVRHASRVQGTGASAPIVAPNGGASPAAMSPAPPAAETSETPAAARSVDVGPSAPRSRAKANAPRERPSAPGALGEQVSALDSARRTLASGDAPATLRQLDEYEARFPGSALADEADVLRVEALVANGDRAGAARVGQTFLAAHPNSPHAARVRALIAP